MTRIVAAGFASLLLSLPPPAIAAVVDSAPGGFTLRLEAVTAAAPGRTWDSLLRIGEWWSGAHTYSGRAANMTLELRAGGCFCERWPGGEIEHMRVALAWPEKRQLVMRDGEDFVVIDDHLVMVDKNWWQGLEGYHINGLHYSVSDCDIVKVLRPRHISNTLLKDAPSNKFHIIYEEKVETEAEKQLKELQKQIQTLTKQADKLGEEIWKGKL